MATGQGAWFYLSGNGRPGAARPCRTMCRLLASRHGENKRRFGVRNADSARNLDVFVSRFCRGAAIASGVTLVQTIPL
ncbi:hypothetical protein GN958_ATG23649 [Phytophthora infestans]|uniref:Uncharacterized protein n=1 Tax=Phytophthora infestans TaxID=4787 RepID=A0A8S9TGR6_PHYIN|nr:hypothetical protein GN958_ATG23649 [Phytophthora infestans]